MFQYANRSLRLFLFQTKLTDLICPGGQPCNAHRATTTLADLATLLSAGFAAPGTRVNVPGLGPEDTAHLNRGLARMSELCSLAEEHPRLTLLVDAEYTYMNPGISAVALAMMMAHNGERPAVGNTYQCYLKVRSVRFF